MPVCRVSELKQLSEVRLKHGVVTRQNLYPVSSPHTGQQCGRNLVDAGRQVRAVVQWKNARLVCKDLPSPAAHNSPHPSLCRVIIRACLN